MFSRSFYELDSRRKWRTQRERVRDVDLVLEADDQNLEALLFSGELAMTEGNFERAAKDFKLCPPSLPWDSSKEELLKK